MLFHYLKLAYRNFRRYKSSFFVNLIGLSTGLACALLIYLWVYDELGMDKFHDNERRLFQVMQRTVKKSGEINVFENTPGPLAQALVDELPEIEYAVPVMPRSGEEKGILIVGEKQVRGAEQYAGKDFFRVFSFELIAGDRNHPLDEKYTVLISDEMARALFNTTDDVVGKKVEWNRRDTTISYHVAGVFKKPSLNSSLQFDLIFPFELYADVEPDIKEWKYNDPNTYLVLKEGVDPVQVNAKVNAFLQERTDQKNQFLFVRKYSDKYLYGKYENGVQVGGRIEYVRLFTIIAIFIVVIACINFMNLSTAKATRRIKEIGVKKAIGAARRMLVFQYLGESLLITFISLVVAVLLVLLFLPQFNEFTGKNLRFEFDMNLILSLLGITLLTGLVSGSYPALYLSGFRTANVLKGKFDSSKGESWARRGLVVFQFTVSVILIVSVLVVYRQVSFIQSKNLGYDKDNIVIFKKEGKLNENMETFMHEVKNIPGVLNATSYRNNLMGGQNKTDGVIWEGKSPDDKTIFGQINVDYDFIETLGMEVIEGRSFSREFSTDDKKVILNEAAIAAMGLKDPLGKDIKYYIYEYQVVGVVKNFHFESLYEPLKPCFIVLRPNGGNVVVKIKAGEERETLASLEQFYHKYNQGLPFEYKFLDEDYQKLYASENLVAGLSKYFAGIAILIACLGLFGLASFTAERRLKEIGIRRILGANDFAIVSLLSGDFTRMVIVSIAIALPVSYLLCKNWLDKFAYHTNLEWWLFAASGLISLFIAWFTVSMQTFKATRVNPTEYLRSE
jgi:putative ABC transport system permease protein